LDVKGAAKFKDSKDQNSDPSQLLTNNNGFDLNKQREVFRKLYTKSAYSIQFGEPPKATEDYVIMKNRKFGELDISTYV